MTNDAFARPEPESTLDEHDYEAVVERGLAEFAKVAPEHAFGVAARLLEDALSLSERPPLAERRQDLSTIWRPSIAHASRYGGSRARESALIDVVRDSALSLIQADPGRLEHLMHELEKREWPLFRRLALYLLLEVPDASLIKEHILSAAELERGLPEHDLIVTKHFGDLSEEDRERYIELVEQRPAPTTHVGGREIDRAEATQWVEEWRIRRLRMVADHLPPRARARYGDLDAAGRPPLASEAEEVEDGWVGERARIDAAGLAAMSMSEIINHLRTWQPSGGFMGPTMRGQADALQAAVTADPTRFSGHAADFRDLDPTYVRALVTGLDEVVKNQGAVAWRPVIELCGWAVHQPLGEGGSSLDRDPGWGWTRRAIADLLGDGLRESVAQAPSELRELIWAVLEPLVGDDPGSSVGDRDPISAALNSNRGAALQSVITYLDWVRRHSPDGQRSAMELAPEAGGLLGKYVDPQVDTSAGTRGAFGLRLVNLVALDLEWVKRHRADFFPHETAPQLARWTWDAYIAANRPYTQLLIEFADDYARAITRIPADSSDRHLDPHRALAEHVLIFYLWGRLDLDDGDSLIRRFYDTAPTWIRAHAAEFAGRVMRDSELDDEQCERLRKLWIYRREVVADRSDEHAELIEFGWWFTAGRCDRQWRLDELLRVIELTGAIEPDSLVLERLAEIASEHPVEALRAVERLVESPRERWFISANIAEIEQVLRTALASQNSRDPARALVNRLAAAGYTGLLKLLGD